MRKTFLIILATIMMVGAAPAADTKAAQACSDAYLKLLDAGQYAKMYESSAAAFQKVASEDAFVSQMKAAVGKLGAVKSRKFVSATPVSDLPGAPKGEYVVIEYKTDFANQAGLKERVTPMKEGGVWKVSGYFVLPGK